MSQGKMTQDKKPQASSRKLRQIVAGSMCHVDCQIDAGGVAKSLKPQASSLKPQAAAKRSYFFLSKNVNIFF
jgi:hypothetical protein